MLSSFIKITVRRLFREKLYALINIAGLALGIASVIILGLYLEEELTYDQHNRNHRQIYRVANELNVNGQVETFATSSPVLGPMLKESYPEIQDYVRFWRLDQKALFRFEDKAFYWGGNVVADSSVFKVFTHEILYGDPETALDEGFAIAVSETFARAYFGDENPIGKIIRSENDDLHPITLVFKDLPENSHLKYDMMFSFNHRDFRTPTDMAQRRQLLGSFQYFTYLVLPEEYELSDFDTISRDFYTKHMEDVGRARNLQWRAWLQPLADIHLYSDVDFDLPTGNPLSLIAFAAVAVFILIVACINYMNMSTARYSKRAKEVGMHKILGADRGKLIVLFFAETLCFTLIGLVLAVILAEVFLTIAPIEFLFGKSISFNLFQQPLLIAWLLLLALLISFVSGLYPAVYLSSAAPLSALVGSKSTGGAGSLLRKCLVLFQFIVTTGVIACTLLMAAQILYIANKPLGFDKENRITLTLYGLDVIEQVPALRNELAQIGQVLGVSTSARTFGDTFPVTGVQTETQEGTMEVITFNHMATDKYFFEVMGLEISEGRDYSRRLLTDIGRSVVVNEAFVRQMNWDNPIGKRMQMGPDGGRVIGVVKDFHFASLHNQIQPFALYPFADNFENVPAKSRPFFTREMVLNISGEDIRQTLRDIEEVFSRFDTVHPFEIQFLDDTLNQLYQDEQRLMKLTAIFTTICIVIACLGLFGLASFTTEQRTKEIGIRKVLGASALQIILLLSRNIILLVLIGAAFASILSYFAMDQWLVEFAYRISINPLYFVVSAAFAVAIAFLTLALQSFKIAQSDPVHSLRTE